MGSKKGFLSVLLAALLLAASAAALEAAPAAAVDLSRGSRAAGIEVIITPLPPATDGSAGQPERLRFRLSLDAHIGDLMRYDLTRLAALRTEGGFEVVSGFLWEPQSESSHHRSGILSLPDPRPGSAGPLELELKGLAASSRLFRWEAVELAALASGRGD